jgi:hypothetical protein
MVKGLCGAAARRVITREHRKWAYLYAIPSQRSNQICVDDLMGAFLRFSYSVRTCASFFIRSATSTSQKPQSVCTRSHWHIKANRFYVAQSRQAKSLVARYNIIYCTRCSHIHLLYIVRPYLKAYDPRLACEPYPAPNFLTSHLTEKFAIH